MDKHTRLKKILNLVLEQGRVETRQLDSTMSVTRETVRRDLGELEKMGFITRSYGQIDLQNREAVQLYIQEKGLQTKKDRHLAIEKILRQKKKMRVSTLANEFHVTPATIRKDIEFLKSNSTILKNHGVVQFDTENSVRKDLSSHIFTMEKKDRLIAERVLGLIKPGETVYLDESIFSFYVAQHISIGNRSTIITCSLIVLQILTDRDYRNETVFLSGIVDYASGIIQIRDDDMFLQLTEIHKAVSHFDSYQPGKGLFVNSYSKLHNMRLILEKAPRVLACLPSKSVGAQGKVEFPIADFVDKIEEIITDDAVNIKVHDLIKDYALPLTICGDNIVQKPSIKSQIKVGLLHSVSNSYFAITVRESIETQIDKHQQLTLVEMQVTDEISITLGLLDKMFKQKIEILIAYINNYEIGQIISDRCHEKGLRLLAIDIPLPNSVFYGVHNFLAGQIGGSESRKYIEERWNNHVDTIINIEVQSAGIISGYRLTGVVEELKKTVSIGDSQIHHLDTALLSKHSDAMMIKRLSGIIGRKNLFLSFNEKSTMLIHSIIMSLPKDSENIIIGHNYNDRIRKLMKTPGSPLIGCIAYHPENYGKDVIRIIENIMNNKNVSDSNYTELEWIPNRQYIFPQA